MKRKLFIPLLLCALLPFLLAAGAAALGSSAAGEECSWRELYQLAGDAVAGATGVESEKYTELALEAGDGPILRIQAARVLYEAAIDMGYQMLPGIEPGGGQANGQLLIDGRNCYESDCADWDRMCAYVEKNDGAYIEGDWRTARSDWLAGFCIRQESLKTGEKVLELTEDGRFRPLDYLTCAEAENAVTRLGDSFLNRITATQFSRPFDPKDLGEIEAAQALGLVPQGWAESLDAPVTEAEFARLVAKVFTLRTGSVREATEQRASEASAEIIIRERAAQLVSWAALENLYDESGNVADASQLWRWGDGFFYAYTISEFHDRYGIATPCMEIPEHWSGMRHIDTNAVLYVTLQVDKTERHTLMDVDERGYLRVGDALTRGEALLTAYRLHGTPIKVDVWRNNPATYGASEADFQISQEIGYGSFDEAYLPEIELAIASGIVPEGIQGDYARDISRAEFYALLGNVLARNGATPDEKWREAAGQAESDKALARQYAARALYEAALLMNAVEAPGNFLLVLPLAALPPESDCARTAQAAENVLRYGVPAATYTNYAYLLEERAQLDMRAEDRYDMYNFVLSCADRTTGYKIMTLEPEDSSFRPAENMTRGEAILSAHRLNNAVEPTPRYVPLEDERAVTTTVDLSLLGRESALPDVSIGRLPAWNGVAMDCWSSFETYALGGRQERIPRELDYQIASELGFNFTRFNLATPMLSYPGYNVEQVNLVMLERLDRIVEWCIKYGIHFQLTVNPPIAGSMIFGENQHVKLRSDAHLRDLYKQWFVLLAKRYRDIPNRFFSLGLANEPGFLDSDAEYTEIFGPLVKAAQAVSPDRVILADTWTSGDRLFGEGLAAMGASLSLHFYPSSFLYGFGNRGDFHDWYAGLDPATVRWPMPFLYNTLTGSENEIVIRGDFAPGHISVYVQRGETETDTYDKDDLKVRIDGKKAQVTEEAFVREYRSPLEQTFTASFSRGAKEIVLSCQSYMALNHICIAQEGREDVWIYSVSYLCPDGLRYPELLVAEDGAVTTEDPQDMYSFASIYRDYLKTYIDLADKHGVGFVLGEMTMGSATLPPEVTNAYFEEQLTEFRRAGIGYCFYGLTGEAGLTNYYPHDGPGMTYIPIPGTDYYLRTDLAERFQRLMAVEPVEGYLEQLEEKLGLAAIGIVTITADSANLRTGDNTTYSVACKAKKGQTFPCLGISGNGWYKVKLDDGSIAFVASGMASLKKK